MKNAYWLDDDGDLAHGSSDNYRTVAEFMTDAAEDERLLIVHRVNVHADLLAALEDAISRLESIAELARHEPAREDIYNAAYAGKQRAALRSARGAS